MKNKLISWIGIGAACVMMLWGSVPAYSFTNKVTVNIPVEVVSTRAPKPKTGVKFTLEAVDGSPPPAGSECVVLAGTRSVMPVIGFDQPGTYVYRLRAASEDPSKASIEGVSDFRVEILVTNGENALRAVVVASDWNAPAGQQAKETIHVVLDSVALPEAALNRPNTSAHTQREMWGYLACGSALLILVLVCWYRMGKKENG